MSVGIRLIGDTLYQWDIGRSLYIDGYESLDTVKVHYTTSQSGVAFVSLPVWDAVETAFRVGIPNTLLTLGRPISVYLYDENLEVNRVVYKQMLYPILRSKPSDYIYDAYEENSLVWPYEDNIEAILLREQERVSSETARRDSELLRSLAETSRSTSEDARISAEIIRVNNEQARVLTLNSLQTSLEEVEGLSTEIQGARGTHATLGERLDSFIETNPVTNVEITEDHELKIYYKDRTFVNLGVIPVTSSGNSNLAVLSIERTSGTGAAGIVDTYTITFNSGDHYDFYVRNGSNGSTGSPGVYQGSLEPLDPAVMVWINPEGDPSELEGATFTPSVSEGGYLSWTNNKGLSNPTPAYIRGSQGLPGPAGSPGVAIGSVEPGDEYRVWIDLNGVADPEITSVNFIPSVSPTGDLSWSNDGGLVNPPTVSIRGPKGDTGSPGSTGSVGPYYIPSISLAGDLSWTNLGGLSNPPTTNIRGPKGDTGAPGSSDATTLGGYEPSAFSLTGHTHDNATDSVAGFMSATDKSNMTTMIGAGAQAVGVGSSPTFGTVTADVVIGAVYQ